MLMILNLGLKKLTMFEMPSFSCIGPHPRQHPPPTPGPPPLQLLSALLRPSPSLFVDEVLSITLSVGVLIHPQERDTFAL